MSTAFVNGQVLTARGLETTGVVIDGVYNARKGAVTITQNGGTVRNCIFINRLCCKWIGVWVHH